MKTKLICCCFCMFPLFLFCQLSKNSFLIDGMIGGQGRWNGFSKKFEFDVNSTPKILFFPSKHFAIGGEIEAKSHFTETGLYKILLESRFYPIAKNNHAPFISLGGGIKKFYFKRAILTRIGLGYDFFLSPNLIFESTINYRYDLLKHERTASKSTQKRIMFNSGFKWFLNGHNKVKDVNLTQLKKGRFYIGIYLADFSTVNLYKKETYLTWSFHPTIGLFLTKRLVLGLNYNYGHSWNNYNEVSSENKDITSFFKYYFTPIDKKIIMFLEGGVGISKWKSISLINSQVEMTENSKLPIFFGNIGLTKFVAPRVALELKVGYQEKKIRINYIQKKILFDLGAQYFLK